MSCRSSIKVISAVFPEPSRVRASVFALSADSSPFNCSHSSMSVVFTFSQPINGCLSLQPYSVSALFDRRFHRLLIPMQFACERRNFLLSHANCIGINSLWNLLSNRADTEYGRRDKHPLIGWPKHPGTCRLTRPHMFALPPSRVIPTSIPSHSKHAKPHMY